MSDVLVEEPDGDGLEGFGDGADLGEDVDAVGVFVDHATDAADLAFDAVEALGVVVLGDGVAAGGGFGHRAWNRRRRRLLVTTKMLDNAMEATAGIGMRRTGAAGGRATMVVEAAQKKWPLV